MKQLSLLFILLIAASFASGQVSKSKDTPNKFAVRVGEAFEKKNLGTLDLVRPMCVRVVIEHSLGEGKDATVKRTFRSLKSAQVWIAKQMIPNAAFRAGKSDGCRRGTCEFTQEYGMLHNHLYLSSFTYGVSRGKFYVKSLSMIDGD